MCGIIGIVSPDPVNQALYNGLTVLQHRGQDAAGIITCDRERVHLRKNNGLVRDVFHSRHMMRMHGNMRIGHVRYPTAGCEAISEFPKWSKYLILLSFQDNSSARSVQIGGWM